MTRAFSAGPRCVWRPPRALSPWAGMNDAVGVKPLSSQALSSCQGRSKGFDHDDFGQLFADGQAGVANLANEVGLAGQQFDDVIFAETQFAQPVLDFRRGAKLFDSHSDSGFDPVQRTNFTTSFFPFCRLNYC